MKIIQNDLTTCDEETSDVLKERHAMIFFLKNHNVDSSIIDKLLDEKHWILGAPYNTKGFFDEKSFYSMLENLKNCGYDKRPSTIFDEDDVFTYDDEVGNSLNERFMIIDFLKNHNVDLNIINNLRAGKHWALGPSYGPGGYFDY